MHEITIREARATDVEAIVGLLAELSEFAHSDGGFTPDSVREVLTELTGRPEIYANYLAEIDGACVGFCSVVFYRTVFHRGGTALVNELVVTGEHRGRGIGSELVARAIRDARARGMDEIEVGTEKGNRRAIDFYRANGFDEEYVLLGMEFDRDGSDSTAT